MYMCVRRRNTVFPLARKYSRDQTRCTRACRLLSYRPCALPVKYWHIPVVLISNTLQPYGDILYLRNLTAELQQCNGYQSTCLRTCFGQWGQYRCIPNFEVQSTGGAYWIEFNRPIEFNRAGGFKIQDSRCPGKVLWHLESWIFNPTARLNAIGLLKSIGLTRGLSFKIRDASGLLSLP